MDTLIEAALVATFAQETDLYRSRVARVIDDAHDDATFREALRTLINDFSHLPASVRLRRTHTIALGTTRPSLAASIAEIQDQITETWSTTIREAQTRGFVRGDLNPHAAAVMVLSLTIGRIVNDAAGNEVRIGGHRLRLATASLPDVAQRPTVTGLGRGHDLAETVAPGQTRVVVADGDRRVVVTFVTTQCSLDDVQCLLGTGGANPAMARYSRRGTRIRQPGRPTELRSGVVAPGRYCRPRDAPPSTGTLAPVMKPA